MTRQAFRKLILLWWLAGIICTVVTLATDSYLPTELRNYYDMAYAQPTAGDWILFGAGFLLLLAAILVSVGLYRFREWVRRLFLPIQIAVLILMPFYGPSVTSGWANALTYLYSLLTGGLSFWFFCHLSVRCSKPVGIGELHLI